MAGTILSNFWAALIAFSFYFFVSFPFTNAFPILTHASILAIAMFVFTFIVRAIIAYVRKGPVMDEEDNVDFLKEEYPPKDSSEDIANIVKSLINKD